MPAEQHEGDQRAQLEVETTLDADSGFTVPALVGTGRVASVQLREAAELDATYYDTAELTLIRSGITLRRRSGGSDAGWHLKLPASGGRLEVQRPLTGASPPAALLALAQAWLRGRDVGPVARLRTTRTVHDLYADDGRRLAELADDAVRAESYAAGSDLGSSSDWREIEVELVDGRADDVLAPVADALLAAGARPAVTTSKLARALQARLEPTPAHVSEPAGAAGVVLAYLREQLAELLLTDAHVRMDEHDAVHRMRVACRRLRSTLASYGAFFTGGDGSSADGVRRLRDEIAWIAGVLGEARDAEVMRHHLLASLDAQPPEWVLGPVAHRIETELGRRYTEAHAASVRALDSQRYGVLLDDLEAFLAEPPFDPAIAEAGRKAAADLLTGRVRHAHHRVEKAAKKAAKATSPEVHDLQMHEVRKAAKRARYAAEVAALDVPTRTGGSSRSPVRTQARAYAKAAKEVQEILGDHHDAVVLRDELMLLATRAGRWGEPGFTYGLLHADLGHRRALDEVAYEAAWQTLGEVASGWPA
ncbi:CHAD domain-containing protein [Spongisporangium articulatum]|uniref:CHAD domain-containing protein n=1 Tax=Spongisporangium articulatum TaxID=3362603 RepID=A0ABW8AJF7_9ACTN